MSKIKIVKLTIQNTPTTTIHQLCQIINDAYEEGEAGMWRGKIDRTNPLELKQFIQNKHIIAAYKDEKIVGSVFVKKMPDNITGEFGMLATHKKLKGHGIGGKLIRAAENWAINQQLTQMRLELLTPTDWEHPTKEFLKKWYSKLGYIPQQKEAFANMFPDLAQRLATSCDFTVWTKQL